MGGAAPPPNPPAPPPRRRRRIQPGGVRGAPSSDCAAHGADHGKNNMHAVAMPCQCTYRPTWMHPRRRMHAGCAPFDGGRLAGPDRRRTMQASQSRRTTTAARITSNPTFQASTKPLPARQAGRRAANHPGWPPGVHAAQDDEPDQPGQTINFFAARAPSAAGGGIMSVGGGGAPWADLPADGSLRYLAGRAGWLSQTGDGGDVRASVPASQRARYLPNLPRRAPPSVSRYLAVRARRPAPGRSRPI